MLLVMLAVAFFAVRAADAAATFRIEQHTDPAGDPTLFHFVETDPRTGTNDFDLRDGEYKDFGPFEGTATARAVVPPGWQVADIKCVGPDAATFVIDVPNGHVQVDHGRTVEDACAFTIRKVPAGSPPPGGGATPPYTGISPTPPYNDPNAAIPAEPAVLRVWAGRRFAAASVRIPARAVIRGQLLRGSRLVGKARIVRNAGTHELRVRLAEKQWRRLRHQGRRRATLTLRIVVAPRQGSTRVFRYGAVVRL